MGIINKFHPHEPKQDALDICEWLDAGMFSGDLLYTTDIDMLKKYVGRWDRAIDEHKKAIKGEKNERN